MSTSAAELTQQGFQLQQAGQFAQAETCYLEALALAPDDLQTRHLLGILYYQTQRSADAVTTLAGLADEAPQYASIHSNLGLALTELGRYDEAIAALRVAVSLEPQNVDALFNLGNALRGAEHAQEAMNNLAMAFTLAPDRTDILGNLALALRDIGLYADALSCYRQLLGAKPNDPFVHFDLSLCLLAAGEFHLGWQEYEWRRKLPSAQRVIVQGFARPRWQDQDLNGKTLLLHAEQGWGDSLQFLRYAPLLRQRGADLKFLLPDSLIALVESQPWGGPCHRTLAEVKGYDYECPLPSLPALFDTLADNIPWQGPYIQVDTAAAAAQPGRRLGLVWNSQAAGVAGSDEVKRRKSCALAELQPLLQLPDVQWVSLQLNPSPEEQALMQQYQVTDGTVGIKSFADTAQQLAALDGLVSIDTAIAHLAGAMGKPLYLLLPKYADWRWALDSRSSPWYPTAQLFRQAHPKDWSAPLADLQQALV